MLHANSNGIWSRSGRTGQRSVSYSSRVTRSASSSSALPAVMAASAANASGDRSAWDRGEPRATSEHPRGPHGSEKEQGRGQQA